MKITTEPYGIMPDGGQAYLYTLENNNHMRVCITNLGGAVTGLFVPDQNGKLADVVLGHKSFEDYLKNPGYLGALVGRNSNRIAEAAFSIGDQRYQLEKNDGENNLHSGSHGLSFRLFTGETRTVANAPVLLLSLTMEDMSDGFPGDLAVNIAYALTDDNALMIDYRAVCDQDTMINLTNHSYFNLAGHNSGNIHGHLLQMDAPYYTPNTAACIPSGEILSVAGTPFDFRKAKPIGQDIASAHEQTAMFGGYDHNFVLDGGGDYRKVITVTEPESGRVMDVYTDLPGVQLYTSNMLDENGNYKDGAKYGKHQAFCLETQLFPNAVNMPWLASPIYRAGEEYVTTTTYQFRTID